MIFWSKLGFKTGLLHIIFKLNHACRALSSVIYSIVGHFVLATVHTNNPHTVQ